MAKRVAFSGVVKQYTLAHYSLFVGRALITIKYTSFMINSLSDDATVSAPPTLEPRETVRDTTPSPRSNNESSTAFLVDVGLLILKNDRQEWMNIEELVQVAKKQRIEFQGQSVVLKELDEGLRLLFDGKEEIYSNGVNVVFSLRRVKWELVPQVRFYRYNPNCNIKDRAVLPENALLIAR
jgi:hypothetical protein